MNRSKNQLGVPSEMLLYKENGKLGNFHILFIFLEIKKALMYNVKHETDATFCCLETINQ